MMSAVAPIAVKPVKGYDLLPGELWSHSISVAIGVDPEETLITSLKVCLFTMAFSSAKSNRASIFKLRTITSVVLLGIGKKFIKTTMLSCL